MRDTVNTEQSTGAAVHGVGTVGFVARHRDVLQSRGSTPDAVIAIETSGVTAWAEESPDIASDVSGSLPRLFRLQNTQ